MPKNMASERLVIDTNVMVVASFLKGHERELAFAYPAEKLTNEYTMKEYRRVLADKGTPSHDVENMVSAIKRNVRVLPTSQKRDFEKIALTDKSDRPIICSAREHYCTLVTLDRRTYEEAQKYVSVKTPKEVLQSNK